MFAAKLFLIAPSTQFSAKDRRIEEKKKRLSKQKEASNELSLWQKLAPGVHQFCNLLTLNDLPALAMPFYPPVPYRDRKNALVAIRDKLMEVGKQGYVFAEKDLRWRHFGCRKHEDKKFEITLLDLGSMTHCDQGDCYIQVVTDQMASLRKRMHEQEKTIDRPVLTRMP